MGCLGTGTHADHQFAGKLAEVKHLEVEEGVPLLEARRFEHLLDDRIHLLEPILDDRERPFEARRFRLDVSVADQRYIAEKHRQRSAKLVGGELQEVRLGALEALEAACVPGAAVSGEQGRDEEEEEAREEWQQNREHRHLAGQEADDG